MLIKLGACAKSRFHLKIIKIEDWSSNCRQMDC